MEGNIVLPSTNNDNKVIEEIYDLVILSVGMIPSSSSAQLFTNLGLSTDKYRFCETDPFQSSKTSREGVFVCHCGTNIARVIDVEAVFLENLVWQVESHPHIDIYKNAEVLNFNGHVGEFQTVISQETEEIKLEHGAIIFATGGREYQPVEYNYGDSDQILTQMDFEKVLTDFPERVRKLETIVMIQCVGSREEPLNYCSRLCCQEA